MHKLADPLTLVIGVSLGAVISQVRITGVVVCINSRAKTRHVGAVSILQHLARRSSKSYFAAALDSLAELEELFPSKPHPFLL